MISDVYFVNDAFPATILDVHAKSVHPNTQTMLLPHSGIDCELLTALH